MLPTILIIHINMPPNTELNANFKIHFIGIIKILPLINNMPIQDTNIRIFMFNGITSKIVIYYYFYVLFWTNILILPYYFF